MLATAKLIALAAKTTHNCVTGGIKFHHCTKTSQGLEWGRGVLTLYSTFDTTLVEHVRVELPGDRVDLEQLERMSHYAKFLPDKPGGSGTAHRDSPAEVSNKGG